jgi:hypothetical protein
VLQLRFAQHGWSMPPQVAQVAPPPKPVQASVAALQVLSGSQHGWPMPPQAAQVPAPLPLQMVFGAVHVRFAQHGLPVSPQVPHLPAAQLPVMPPPHAAPLAMHTLATQQPPPAQVFPSQHCCPAAPHV